MKIEQGTGPFMVFINEKKVYETNNHLFSVDVKQGDEVKIKSSKDCEGEIIEKIDFYKKIITYPNPITSDFQFLLPINEGMISIEIYDVNSRLISSKQYNIESGKIKLSLKNKPTGIYFAKVMSEKPVFVKLIKK